VLVGGDSATELRGDWLLRTFTATDTVSQTHTDNATATHLLLKVLSTDYVRLAANKTDKTTQPTKWHSQQQSLSLVENHATYD